MPSSVVYRHMAAQGAQMAREFSDSLKSAWTTCGALLLLAQATWAAHHDRLCFADARVTSSVCRHMAAQEAQMAREFSDSMRNFNREDDMWGFPPEDTGSMGSVRTPQQIWSSMSARDKRDLTRKVMARRTPTQAQVCRPPLRSRPGPHPFLPLAPPPSTSIWINYSCCSSSFSPPPPTGSSC